MRILFVGIDLNRKDMVLSVKPASEQAECYFLENFKEDEVITSVAHTLGTIIFWKNYSDATELLQSIKPQKVVFQLIDNYYHIALFFAARHLQKIPIWYMDHGIRFENVMLNMDSLELGTRTSLSRRIVGKNIKSFVALLKNSFFRKTKAKLPSFSRKNMQQVFKSRSKNNFAIFMRESGHLLQPDGFIAFSPETFAFHKIFFSLPLNYENKNTVHYVGIPSLDNLKWTKDIEPVSVTSSFLLIDQPLHEQSLLGWTEHKKIEFIIELIQNLQKFNLKLVIKPHPWNSSYYDKIPPEIRRNIKIIEHLTEENLEGIKTVSSFHSTLLLAFCASSRFSVICFEMHPHVVNPPLSYDITKFGVAIGIKNFQELEYLLVKSEEENFTNQNKKIEEFTRLMLYKFDGLSLKRLNEAILSKG